MKLHSPIFARSILLLLVFLASKLPACAQTTPPSENKSLGQTAPKTEAIAGANISEELQPGIVVDKVEKNTESEKAGLREGDILLSWNRGETQGRFESPFDVAAIEMEQSPRGTVTLVGYRGAERRIWTLGQDDWYLKTRPALSENVLSSYRRGEGFANAGKFVEATRQWRAAAVDSKKSSSILLSIWFLFHSADVLATARKWMEADHTYQEAIEKAATVEPAISAQLFRSWASTYAQRGNLERAEQCLRQSLRITKKVAPGSLALAASFFDIGSYAGSGNPHADFRKSEDFYEQALTLREKLAPHSRSFAQSLDGLALAADRRGDLVTAEKYSLRAKAIDDELGINDLFTLSSLAAFAYERGDLMTAEGYASKVAAVAQALPAPKYGLVQSLFCLGLIAWKRGDLVRAADYYRQALAAREKLFPDQHASSHLLSGLGLIAQARGDLTEANAYYLQALSVAQKWSPHSFELAMIMDNLGTVAEEKENLFKAEEYYRRAHAVLIAISSNSIYEASVLDDMGVAACKRGDLTKAKTYLLRALQIERKLAPDGRELAGSLNHLGDVFRDSGNLAKAEDYYRRALQIRSNFAPGSKDVAESLASLAAITRRQHRADAAEQFYSKSLEALDRQDLRLGGGEETRFIFRAKYVSNYKDYIDLLLSEKQLEHAFEISERLRARILFETLTVTRANIRKGVDARLLDTERSLQESINSKSTLRMQLLSNKKTDEQIAAFDKQISGLLAQYKDLEEQILTSSPSYAALTQPQPLSVKEVQQKLLDTNTVLLEYSLGKERSYVFAVAPDSLNAYELPRRSEIEHLARRTYALLTERNRPPKGESKQQRQIRSAKAEVNYSRVVAELSQMVLAPVAGELQSKRLLIVSDGALQYIPFAILPKPKASNSTGPVPLIAEHEIINLPSASVLAVLQQQQTERKPASKEIAVLADPVFAAKDERVSLAPANSQDANRKAGAKHPAGHTAVFDAPEESDLDRSAKQLGISGFPRLPFTRREAEAIYSITGKDNALEALDFDASKATALSSQLKDYRIVHFATHGLLNNEHPELSGLVLSLVDKNGNEQDGFLRMLDIYNMDLNADLVVLSACQTALGKEIGEEGLIGLTRGFMYAGAPRVVASLWKVDDEATAELMKKFYEGMLRDHQTPAQALRGAQQWMRTQKQWQSPYYWAGFVLQGEWR